MVANTTRGITYPTGTDQVAPLHTVFATMATSIDTALGKLVYRPADFTALAALAGMTAGDPAIVQEGGVLMYYTGTRWAQMNVARFATASARDTAYAKAAAAYKTAEATAYITGTQRLEQYLASDAVVVPARPAGWYPIAGKMPTVGVTTSGTVASNSIPVLNVAEITGTDIASEFSTVGTTVTLPALHGRYKLESFLSYAVNSVGGRINAVTVDGTNLLTNGVANAAFASFNESYSTVSKEVVLAGGNVIRVYGGSTSTVSLAASGKFTATYLGPA